MTFNVSFFVRPGKDTPPESIKGERGNLVRWNTDAPSNDPSAALESFWPAAREANFIAKGSGPLLALIENTGQVFVKGPGREQA